MAYTRHWSADLYHTKLPLSYNPLPHELMTQPRRAPRGGKEVKTLLWSQRLTFVEIFPASMRKPLMEVFLGLRPGCVLCADPETMAEAMRIARCLPVEERAALFHLLLAERGTPESVKGLAYVEVLRSEPGPRMRLPTESSDEEVSDDELAAGAAYAAAAAACTTAAA